MNRAPWTEWMLVALAGALANAVAGTLAKAGLARVAPTLATAITSSIVAVATVAFTIATGNAREVADLDRRSWVYLVLSGLATAGAYLLYFRALDVGKSAQVQPVDRLSLVFAVVLAAIFLRERVGGRTLAGATLMTLGAIVIATERR